MRHALRLRARSPARVPLDMTPLIDIVFQLLIFFVLTLQIAPAEGQFEMQLPIGGNETSRTDPQDLLPLVVRLRAGEDGRLAEIWLGDERLGGLSELHDRVAALVAADPRWTAHGRVELRCDRDLAYEHAIAALTAVGGSRRADGSIQRLIEQVSLAEGG